MVMFGRGPGGFETSFPGRRLDIIYKVYLALCSIAFSLCKHRGKLIQF